MRSLQDHELAALAIAGERPAFSELARRHSSGVRSLLRRMGAQPALADDLAQDALVIAFERLDTFRNDGPFAAWLNRIAARLYVKRWHVDARVDLFADPTDYATAATTATSDWIDLDKALQTLSAAERLCVSLCHGAGFSHTEAATALNLPLGTVKSHVKRGLEKLQTILAPSIESSEHRHHD